MSLKVKVGLCWLVIGGMCALVLTVANAGAGDPSDGERLVADVAGAAMAITGSIGVLFLLSALFPRRGGH